MSGGANQWERSALSTRSPLSPAGHLLPEQNARPYYSTICEPVDLLSLCPRPPAFSSAAHLVIGPLRAGTPVTSARLELVCPVRLAVVGGIRGTKRLAAAGRQQGDRGTDGGCTRRSVTYVCAQYMYATGGMYVQCMGAAAGDIIIYVHSIGDTADV